MNEGTVQDTSIVANIAPIRLSRKRIRIGRVSYEDEAQYEELRKEHAGTHVFRFDQRDRKISNVSIVEGEGPVGEVEEEAPVGAHLMLLGKAIQQSILSWLANHRTIIRRSKPLVFWGGAGESRLLSRAIEDSLADSEQLAPTAPDALEVTVRYMFDTRVFKPSSGIGPYLGLLVDLHTSNVINLPISELMGVGLNATGSYVCRRQAGDDDLLLPRLETLGMVSRVKGGRLLLTDNTGVDDIDAKDALLEPRQENLEQVIELLYGRAAPRIISRLRQLRGPYGTAAGKLDKVELTLRGLRRHHIVLDGGEVEVHFEDLLARSSPLFPSMIPTGRPGFLLGAQGRQTADAPDLGIRRFGPYKYMQHAKNEPLIAVVCEASMRGRVEQFAESLRGGFPEEVWAATRRNGDRKPNPYVGGLLGKFRLTRADFEFEGVKGTSAAGYRTAIKRLLERLPRKPDLAIVQTRDEFKQQRGDDNPYLVSKAAFMEADVPVQAITSRNIEANTVQLPYILNNVALASYAKLDGVPWVISTRSPSSRELVIGMGYTEVSEGRLGDKTRYVGITTLFQGDGRYLVWGLTREVEFQDYAEALLANLQTTIRHIKTENDWQKGDHVRLVFHVYKPLKHKEIDAVRNLVDDLVREEYSVEYAFLDLSSRHMYQLFAPAQEGVRYFSLESRSWRTKGKGVPERGLCVELDERRALLHLTGPRELKAEEQGAPQPLLIEVHPDSDLDDLTYLTRQVYHFTYLSWRSFFPATEPVTILYSRLIAKALGNLRSVTGWSSKATSVGGLRDNKWFL